MKHSHLRILIFTVTVFAFGGLFFGSRGLAREASPDAEKSLDIERYADEPLELVDLRVGSNSVKGGITTKVRRNAEGLDNVKFTETADWHRRVSLTLRNISAKTVTGLRAYLYFKAAGSGQLFRMQLEQAAPKAPTAPGGEINVMVGAQTWGLVTNLIKQKGVDPDQAEVRLAVEAVMFSDDSQWYEGMLLHRDPASPNTWRVTEVGHGTKN
jgi:hypothetical protein